MCVYTHIFIFTCVSNRAEVLGYWVIAPGDPLAYTCMFVFGFVCTYPHVHIYMHLICIHNRCSIVVPSYQGNHRMYIHVCLCVYLHTHSYIYMHVTRHVTSIHTVLSHRTWDTLEYIHTHVCMVVLVSTHIFSFFLSFFPSHVHICTCMSRAYAQVFNHGAIIPRGCWHIRKCMYGCVCIYTHFHVYMHYKQVFDHWAIIPRVC